MNPKLNFVFEIIKIVVLALAIVLPIRYFVFQPFIVKGASMEPNFHNGDYLIVDELSYNFREPARGEVIVFRYPYDPSQRFIKRVIGLPLETVSISQDKIEITDKFGAKKTLQESTYIVKPWFSGDYKITLGPDEYFVLGDNRLSSSDSRRWGAVKRTFIVGRTFFRAWPLNQIDLFTVPAY